MKIIKLMIVIIPLITAIIGLMTDLYKPIIQFIKPSQSIKHTEASVSESCPEFSKGEKRIVFPGTYISGDIVIDDIPQYDEGGDGEGTIAFFEKEAKVYAQWGAGCLKGDISQMDAISQRELTQGCGGNGCTKIRQVIVSEDGQHIRYYPK